MSKPITIAITEGDPAGIGPEVIARSIETWERPDDCRLAVLGFPAHFEAVTVGNSSDAPHRSDSRQWMSDFEPTRGTSWIQAGADELNQRVKPGVGSADGHRAAVRCIERAIELAMRGDVDAICTAPVNKEGLAEVGFPFPGHTEMLAARTESDPVAMMLCGGGLRVVLATIHEPLADVPRLLNKEKLIRLFELIHDSMPCFGITKPKIGVAGLNPHAGEGGRFGGEETAIIAPAIACCRERGIDVRGPFPADTLFHRALEGEFDVTVAMYHDQGLIPIKTLDFYGGVNVTLGLPFVRTSPDHGTAYDLAGRGAARCDSFLAALDLAYRLASERRRLAESDPASIGAPR